MSSRSSRQARTTRSLSWLLRPDRRSSGSGIDLANTQYCMNTTKIWLPHWKSGSRRLRRTLSPWPDAQGVGFFFTAGPARLFPTPAARAWEGSSAGHARGSEPPVRAMSPQALKAASHELGDVDERPAPSGSRQRPGQDSSTASETHRAGLPGQTSTLPVPKHGLEQPQA